MSNLILQNYDQDDDFIFECYEPNGEIYLTDIEFEIPLRIKNILKKIYFKDEIDFYKELDKIFLKYTSYYLFPNDIIFFYPKIQEHIAKKEFTCCLSGAPIKPGELYHCYRPLLENISTGQVFTIRKNIIASNGYYDLFPETLLEFEIWCQKLSESYYRDDDKIDFYGFSTIAGTDALDLRLLENNPIKRQKRQNLKQLKKLQEQLKELTAILPYSIDNEEINKRIEKINNKIKKINI